MGIRGTFKWIYTYTKASHCTLQQISQGTMYMQFKTTDYFVQL